MSKIVAVSAGSRHGLGLRDDGTVVTWGRGGPALPSGLGNAVAIAAGNFTSIVLRADGTVVGFGNTKVPDGLDDVVAVAAGAESCFALKANGRVVGWKSDPFLGKGESKPLLGPIRASTAISVSGFMYNLSLQADGTVESWSDGWYGATPPPAALTAVKAVAAGSGHGLALLRDGTVVTWGEPRQLSSANLEVPPGLRGVKAIAAGGAHSLALREDGTVVAWGHNDYGQAQAPVGMFGVIAVSAGLEFSLALKSTGRVVAWGRNQDGQTDVPLEFREIDTGGDPLESDKRGCQPLILLREVKTRFLISSGSPNEDFEETLSRLPSEHDLRANVEKMTRLLGSEMDYDARCSIGRSLNNLGARYIVSGSTLEAGHILAEAEEQFVATQYRRDNWHSISLAIWLGTVRYNQSLALLLCGRNEDARAWQERARIALEAVGADMRAHYTGMLDAALDALEGMETSN